MTRWTSLTGCFAGALAAVAVAISSIAVGAAPLAKDACDLLTAEKARLVASGVADRMSKGPIWGKANLAAEKLREIERFIEVEEQLSFRCGFARVKLGPEPPDPEATPAVAPSPPKRRPVSKAPVAKAPSAAAPTVAPAAAPAPSMPAPPAAVAPRAPKPATPRPKPAPAAKAPAPLPSTTPDAPVNSAPPSTGLPPG